MDGAATNVESGTVSLTNDVELIDIDVKGDNSADAESVDSTEVEEKSTGSSIPRF